ncbi:MAG: methionine gamma-lyase family protein [Clostridia bacterium]|nr:methionine gamma-lyase family protein [Clostridia bacterium]
MKIKFDFEFIDEICEKNSKKILKAFKNNKVSEIHFANSTGYGYGDSGREIINNVFAESFGAESALVSSGFVSGTHAIATAIFGLLRPQDTILFITGKPYDTLEKLINGENSCSLKDFNIATQICDFLNNNIEIFLGNNPKVVYIQRSMGYNLRKSLKICDIENLIKKIRKISPTSIILVDNCYGEFVQKQEPTEVGADLIVGSLIKNPGAGIAPSGGYIAGKKNLVELCEQRFLAPGLKNMGATHFNREILMGLFYAPLAVREALKTANFASKIFKQAGFEVLPGPDEERADIITAINLKSEENLKIFCKCIQNNSPVDSFVTPEPWEMPGYDHKIIMASGGFISGSSIELSADAPLKEPYTVWLQGGTNFYLAKYALINALELILKR